MKAQSPARTGIFIVRLWMEQNTVVGLRAHISEKLDSTDGEHVTHSAATPDGIYDIVRTWVEEFVHSN